MRLNVTASPDVKEKYDVLAEQAVSRLVSVTPSQAATWVENNVNSLAEAKVVLKAMVKVLVVLVRQSKRLDHG